MADEPRFYARSASDKTDDWPFWFVADRDKGGLNVTVTLLPRLHGIMPFVGRPEAEELASKANG